MLRMATCICPYTSTLKFKRLQRLSVLNVYKRLFEFSFSRFEENNFMFSNTYSQIHIQLVFAVKFRASMIQADWKERLHSYVTAVLQKDEHKMLQVNSMPDHIHIFGGFRPHQAISGIVQRIKSASSKWINDSGICKSRFEWQGGYGAFSYSKSQVNSVIRYIQNQEAHHKNVS